MIESSLITGLKISSIGVSETFLISDGEGIPIYYPTLFSQHLFENNFFYKAKKVKNQDNEYEEVIEERAIDNKRSKVFVKKVVNYLDWLQRKIEQGEIPNITIHQHTQVPENLINKYVNEYLVDELGEGGSSVTNTIDALNAYYTSIAVLGVSKAKTIRLGKNRQKAVKNNIKRNRAYKYLSRDTRSALLRQCKTKCETLVLEFGLQNGLRTMELTRLFMDDFKYNGEIYPGFLSLIKELKSTDSTQFKYYLTLAKGEVSRYITISRELLQKCKDYCDEERLDHKKAKTLFVTHDNNTKGSEISREFGSNIFKRVRDRLIQVNPKYSFLALGKTEKNSYHHCRHTFATEKFYELLNGRDHHSVNEGDDAIIGVAKLLGHKLNHRNMLNVTRRYIRGVDEMLRLEAA